MAILATIVREICMRKRLYFYLTLAVTAALAFSGCSQTQTSSEESATQTVTESVEAFDPIKDRIEALGEASPRVISAKTENFVLSLEFGEFSDLSITSEATLHLTNDSENEYSTHFISPALGGPSYNATLPKNTEFVLIASETDVFPLFAAVMVPISMSGEIKYYTTLYCFDGSKLEAYFPEGKEGMFFPIIKDTESVSIKDNTFYYTEENGEPKELAIVQRDWL